MMLAAYGFGLGTCWIGFAQDWLGTADSKAALGVPLSYSPIAPIIIGHPLRKPTSVPRKAPNIRWLIRRAPRLERGIRLGGLLLQIGRPFAGRGKPVHRRSMGEGRLRRADILSLP